uniref:Uncharacterized protein n=1 Tax=Meloidogyne hapla TaxID=6305 RepID=A0A1I8C2B4_MELHA
MKNMPNSNTIPSTLSSSNITVFNKQRKCFLIDTLLEQRQKRLAASNKRENETLHCSSISDSNKSHENREKINKMDFEDNNEARFQELKKESVDKEETIEETLPSLCHFECHDVESKEEKNEDENEQRKSLLDTLMKLLPVVQPQSNSNNSNYEVESKSNDSRAGHSQNSFIQQQPQQKLAVAAATAAAASMEFLQRVRLFQQHLTSNGSQIIQHHPNTRQIPSNNSSHSTPNSG